jgi:cation diffusion facilitator CzcD-associated flavoprotein CzcO
VKERLWLLWFQQASTESLRYHDLLYPALYPTSGSSHKCRRRLAMPTHSVHDTAPYTGSATIPQHVRVAIVGAGFSGLGLAIRLTQKGINDFVVLERGGDVGGTWRDNTYPGCACDVPSHLYSFSFAPNPAWTRTFSPQREILAYLRSCAERFGILPHICWNAEVLDAWWDEERQQWHITTASGHLTAQILALGNGPLSEPSLPAIPGLDRFTGTIFHSARWKHDHDLTGKRVAVIGTGASAIQFVPRIQPQAGHLMLFQRTPPWILPRLDRPISARRRALFRVLPLAQRLARGAIYVQRELLLPAFTSRPHLMSRAERLALRHLEAQVADPALRARLTPTYRMGCKRILLSDDFYPALTQENVELVTEQIREVWERGIVTEDSIEHTCDTIIFATGFHVTDMPLARCVRGRAGQALSDAWRDGPRAYLGTTVAGFPNLFLLIGPNTGLGHSSMIFMIESQLAYILDALRLMNRRGTQAVEVRAEAQASFNEEMQRRMRGTVWASGCASWYLDAGGFNSALWPGFIWEYRRRTRRFDLANYTESKRR